MVTPDDPIQIVVTRGTRAQRLEALARIPAGADVSALHKLAADKAEDAAVRSAVIVQLAKRGQEAKAEPEAPPAVRAALTRATRVLHAQRLVAGFEAGILSINHCGGSVHEAPSGGFKESGHGREGGPEGLDGYLVTKRVSHLLED
jgi:hypothetical protein